MRLLTWKAAARAAAGQGLRARGRPGPAALRRPGDADRPRRRPAARRARLRQGAPGGAVVPRPPGRLGHGRRGAGLHDHPSTTRKKLRQLRDQAHQVAMNMLRPISRTYDRAEHAYPQELDLLAAMIDGLSESGASSGAGASGVKRDESRADADAEGAGRVRNGTNLASVMSIAEMCWGDVGLLLSLPRQGLGNSAIASVGNDEQQERFGRRLGLDGDHRARHRLGLREHPDHRRPRRRRVRPQRREDLRHLRRAVRRGRRLGDARQVARPSGDQVVRRTQGHARHDGRAARAQARHPRLRHGRDPLRRLPGPGREPPRLAGHRPRARASPARWRPSTTPARWSPRWPSAAPGPRST